MDSTAFALLIVALAVGSVCKYRRINPALPLITNTLAKDKEILDTWRKYPRPGSSRNRGNMVEDAVVDALASAVVADYPRLSHRYYMLKAKWLGVNTVQLVSTALLCHPCAALA